MPRRKPAPSPDQLALLAEAVAAADGLVRAVTTRQRSPDAEGQRRAALLTAMADAGLVQLHAITGDRNSPVGEHALVFVVTESGRKAAGLSR